MFRPSPSGRFHDPLLNVLDCPLEALADFHFRRAAEFSCCTDVSKSNRGFAGQVRLVNWPQASFKQFLDQVTPDQFAVEDGEEN